jgi:hypothetical protein
MGLQITAVAKQGLSRDHVGTPTDTKVIMALRKKKGIFCAARAEMYKTESQWS